jgi:hypothetical protein
MSHRICFHRETFVDALPISKSRPTFVEVLKLSGEYETSVRCYCLEVEEGEYCEVADIVIGDMECLSVPCDLFSFVD